MRYAVAAVSLFACASRAVTIDQIAITIDRKVITESQVDEEIRVAAFLNQLPAVDSPEQRRAAAARLVDQALIREEIALTNYPPPEEAAIDAALERIKSLYGAVESWQHALASAQLDEGEIRRHLSLQIATLRFVGFRFRPEAAITDSDVEEYFQRASATSKAEHPDQQLPTLDSSRNSIRRALIEERTDQALNDWLEQAHKRSHVVYLDKALEPPRHP
jgi:hypothetical protein